MNGANSVNSSGESKPLLTLHPVSGSGSDLLSDIDNVGNSAIIASPTNQSNPQPANVTLNDPNANITLTPLGPSQPPHNVTLTNMTNQVRDERSKIRKFFEDDVLAWVKAHPIKTALIIAVFIAVTVVTFYFGPLVALAAVAKFAAANQGVVVGVGIGIGAGLIGRHIEGKNAKNPKELQKEAHEADMKNEQNKKAFNDRVADFVDQEVNSINNTPLQGAEKESAIKRLMESPVVHHYTSVDERARLQKLKDKAQTRGADQEAHSKLYRDALRQRQAELNTAIHDIQGLDGPLKGRQLYQLLDQPRPEAKGGNPPQPPAGASAGNVTIQPIDTPPSSP